MRKIVTIILVVVFSIVLFTACTSNESQKISEETAEVSQEAVDEVTEELEEEPIEEPEEVIEPEPEPEPEQPETVVYEDDNITLSFLEWNDDGVLFDCENKTEKTVTIQCEALSINGGSYGDVVMYGDVAPESTGTVEAGLHTTEDSYYVNTLSGQFRVIDFDTRDSYNADFTDVVVNPDVPMFDFSFLAGYPLLYTSDDVDVYFWTIWDDGSILFFVNNKTDRCLTFQGSAISINERSYSDFVMSDPVAQHGVGFIEASDAGCDIAVADVETIGGKLRMIDFGEHMNSHDIEIDKITVDDGIAAAQALAEEQAAGEEPLEEAPEEDEAA